MGQASADCAVAQLDPWINWFENFSKSITSGVAQVQAPVLVSGNVYTDHGEMKIKADLARKIHEIIKLEKMSQQKAAELVGMTQPKLSLMLRGQFRGISPTKMIQCLNRAGRDVQIIVKPQHQILKPGRVEVVCIG